MGRYLLFLTFLLAAIFPRPVLPADRASPKTEVLTGATLRLGQDTVALHGIWVPGPGTQCRLKNGKPYDCGEIARTALMDLVAGSRVQCVPAGKAASNIKTVRCHVGGFDLSRNMVHTGWALAWPRADNPLRAVESRARKAQRGLWRGRFDMPR